MGLKGHLHMIFNIRNLRQVLFVLVSTLFMLFSTSFAGEKNYFTKIGNIKLYSEYYPNSHAKFKGTIVFQNGAGTSLKEWTQNKTFFNCVRKYGNLFMYDRSGLGKSPPDMSMSLTNPMTPKIINHKLMALLKKRKVKPPYIIVAHSYGGLYAGYFARKHPTLVTGMLMIDPVPNNYEWSDAFLNQFRSIMQKMKKQTTKELYAQHSYAKANKIKILSAQLFFQLIGFEQSKSQVNKLPELSNKIPIIILSSSYMEKHAPIKGDWHTKQKQWLNTNPNSKIIKVNSSHFIQLEHPKLVCDQIKLLVMKNNPSTLSRLRRIRQKLASSGAMGIHHS